MIIKITRTLIKGEYAHGHLTIDGLRICETLENSSSCVPVGTYTVTLQKCKQYSRKMPCFNAAAPCSKCPKQKLIYSNSVLPCYCPMLKPGNGVHHRLDGSILIGHYNSLGSLVHPKDVFDQLYERIRKSISRGHQVTLNIFDD